MKRLNVKPNQDGSRPRSRTCKRHAVSQCTWAAALHSLISFCATLVESGPRRGIIYYFRRVGSAQRDSLPLGSSRIRSEGLRTSFVESDPHTRISGVWGLVSSSRTPQRDSLLFLSSGISISGTPLGREPAPLSGLP